MRKSHSAPPFQNLDLWLMTDDSHRLAYGGFLLLHDNIYNECPEQFLATIGSMTGRPCKCSCHLGIICLGGEVGFKYRLMPKRVTAGEAACIPAGTLCELTSMSPDTQLILVGLRPELLPPYASTAQFAEASKIILDRCVHRLTDLEMQTVVGLYRLMRHTIVQPQHFTRQEVIEGVLKTLMAEGINMMLREASSEREEGKSDRQRAIFEQFLNLVRENYRKERFVSFYADRMCLTPKYLSLVVYRVSGRHAGEWIRDLLALDAKALLQSGKYTVSQVADLLGFPNNSFFGKWFKAVTGLPPKQYACGVQ